MQSENELDNIVYCAGLLDGEGSFSVTKRILNKKKRTSPYYEAIVCASMTSPFALELLQKTFGGSLKKAKKPTKTGKDIWQWRIHAFKAQVLTEHVLPFLKVKTEQAKGLLAFRKLVNAYPKGGGKLLTDEEIAKREELHQIVTKLNG